MIVQRYTYRVEDKELVYKSFMLEIRILGIDVNASPHIYQPLRSLTYRTQSFFLHYREAAVVDSKVPDVQTKEYESG